MPPISGGPEDGCLLDRIQLIGKKGANQESTVHWIFTEEPMSVVLAQDRQTIFP